MPRRIVTNSFVSGEISPELYGRHDLKAYFNGAALLENFIVRRTGGIRKRAGTELLAALDSGTETDADTLDNKFKCFHYFYDTTNFGLLVFRITAAGQVQTKFIAKRGVADAEYGAWTDPQIDTQISATADFDDLRCRQIGDTLFFTRLGYRSFMCRVSFAAPSVAFEMLDNAISVPQPSDIAGTPAGGDYATAVGAQDIIRKYALYGVKNGIISKPALVDVAAKTPWLAGATITITGSLDFEVHDSYILAKKSGWNYGKLADIYPGDALDSVKLTLESPDGSDIDAEPAGGGIFNSDAALLLVGGRPKKSTDTSSVSAMPYCMALKPDTATSPGFYRYITPHYAATIPAGVDNIQVRISANQQAVKISDMSVADVQLKSTPAKITPFTYKAGDTDVTVGATQVVTSGTAAASTASDCGEWRFNLPVAFRLADATQRVGFIIEIATAYPLAKDGLFLGMVGMWRSTTTSAMLVASAVSAIPDDIDIPSATKTVYATSQRLVFAKYNDVMHSTLWQKNTAADTAMTVVTMRDNNRKRTKETCYIPSAGMWNTSGSWLSWIRFAVPRDDIELTSITIYGGATILKEDGERLNLTAATVTATLYNIDGATETPIGEFVFNAAQLESKEFDITYPVVDKKKDYKIVFSEAVAIRGIEFSQSNKSIDFVDDNILPGAITGQQEMLTVGDVNMDCGLFDIFEQRGVFASSNKLPFTLWFSVVGDIHNFYALRPQADDDAFSVTIPAKKASRILHILCGKDILLFTEDGVYGASPTSGVGLSFRTIQIKKICSAAASESSIPILMDGKCIFVGVDGRTVYELKYDLMEDATIPVDRSVMAYHLTETAKIVKIAYQRFPDSVVWFLLDDGNLLAMTYMPEHEVYGWSHHSFAANASNQKLVDIIESESIQTGSGIDTTSDLLLVFESYGDDGARGAKTVIERMRPAVCSDSPTAAASACTDHLGGDHPAAVAASLRTLRPESQEVSTQGIPKNVVDVCLRIRRSGKLSVAAFESGLTAMTTAAPVAAGGTVALISRDVKVMPRGFIGPDGQLVISSADSYPCEILSAVYTLEAQN